MAEVLGLKRTFVPVPSFSTGIYAYMASLITPVPMHICRCLLECTRNEVVCLNDEIRRLVPFKVLDYREAILRALSRQEQDRVHTRWSDAYPPAHELAIKLHELEELPTYTSYIIRCLQKKAPRHSFVPFAGLAAKRDGSTATLLWRIRGAMDRVLMGVGTSRGRKSATTLGVNDVIDFWRVEDYKTNERLLLRAEMKLPGRACARVQN